MSRRQFLAFLLSTVTSLVLGQRAGAGPSDQGIGGTGLKPPIDESDRGIGGTGVIGTIRKFGSIVVNDLRIAYPQDADVRIDGRPAAIADLKIGQVVRVAASGKQDALSTRTIDVTHEVVGPVEKVDDSHLTVLGQKVSTTELEKGSSLNAGNAKVGDVVAVSGLRRNDGTIAASLIERSPGARSRIAGPLTKDDDGVLKIGDREVVGVDKRLVGQRVVIEGVQSKVHFVAVETTPEKGLLPPSVRKLSIESYVERRGDALRSGSGYAISGDRFDVPSGRSIRAVLQTNVGEDGRLTVESLRAGDRTYRAGGLGGRGSRGRGSGGRGPGGRGPGGRGPGGRGPDGRGPGGRGPGGRGPDDRGPDGRGPGGRGPGGRGRFGGRGGGERGFEDREPRGGGRGRRGRGGGGRGGHRGAGFDGSGGRLPMDFGREPGGPFDGGRGGGGPGGFAGGGGPGGGYGGPGGGPGGFGGGPGGGGPGGFGGGGFGGGPGGGGPGGGFGGGGGRH